jgi:SAM-dependent methyltransferase
VSWEPEAENWLRWARTPGHDAYWHYRDSFFEAIVPAPSGLTLDLGTGEGRVARDLVERGHRVVGVDSSRTLTHYAREADDRSRYLVAAAEALPFADRSFELVVAYNALMDVDDLGRSVAEASRVLTAGGRLCASVTHPLADAGRFGEGDAFVIEGSYLERSRFEDTDLRNGLVMNWRGWTHPLADYTDALESAGLLIETVQEPAPASINPRWRRIPMFLQFRALKPGDR